MSFVQTNPSRFQPLPHGFQQQTIKPKCSASGRRHANPVGIGATTSGLISSSAGAASSLLPTLAFALNLAPVVGQIAGAALAITAVIASMFKGCGQTCILTTNEVNQVEPYMQQNLSQYLAAPVSAATQQEALANFDQLWAGVVAYCSQPSMASAGKRCISDRQSGSCAYKVQSVGSWQGTTWVPGQGANGSGQACWNWFVGYRDPIANDPRPALLPAASSVTASGPGIPGLPGFNLQSLLLPALLLGGGLILVNVLGDL